MEFNTTKVSLTLNTSDISTSNTIGDYPLTNTIGYVSQYRTSAQWYAVNIKNLLGDLYDKYELFNIQLECAGYTSGTTLYGATFNDLCLRISLSGLDWVYSNYNATSNTMTSKSIVGACVYGGFGVADVGNLQNLMCNTFRKCITTNLCIDLYTVMGASPNMNANTIFPQLSFKFIITPVE